MNAMLNIQIRVLGQQAAAQLKMMQSQLNAMERSTAGSSRALQSFGGNMGNLTNRMERFGKNIQWSGRQLEYNFTLPLALAAAASTKWALENEKAMVRVKKVYGDLGEDTTAELAAIERSFELLSNRFGVHKAEVTDIGAAWAQAGAAGVALSKATRSTLEAMVLGELEAVDATQKMIAVQSAYRLNTDELGQAISDLNVIENQTSINFGGLIEVITRAGGAAREAGVDMRHLGAMASVLVPAAGSASQAGNGLRTMMTRLMSPTKATSQLLEEMGINIRSTSWLAKTGTERVEDLSRAFHDLTQNQKINVAKNAASLWQINRFNLLMADVYLSLDKATRSQSSYATALDATADSQKAAEITARELSTVLSSSPQAFKILTTNIKNSMAQAILPLLPVMISLLKTIADLVRSFNQLPDSTRQLIITFAVLLAIVGPLGRYIGSLGILFSTLGHAFHGVMRLGSSLIGVFFGMTGAQAANLTVSELENASFFRKHGLIGGLARIIAGPFILAYKGLIAVMALTASGALSLIGLLGHGMYTALRIFSGAVFSVAGAAVSWLVGVLPAAAMATVSAMGRMMMALPAVVSGAMTAIRTATLTGLVAMRGAWIGFVAGTRTLMMTLPLIAAAVGRGIQIAWLAGATAMHTAWTVATTGIATLWRTMPLLAGVIGQAITIAWQTTSTAAYTAWQITTTTIAALWRTLPLLAAATGKAIQIAWIATATAMRTAMVAGYAAMTMATRAFTFAFALNMKVLPVIWASTLAIMRGLWMAFMLFMSGGPQMIVRIFAMILTAMVTMSTGILAGIGKMIAGVLNFGRILAGLKVLLMAAIANPFTVVIGIVIAAITALTVWIVHTFRDEIVGGIMDAFRRLPEGIQSTLITVVQMIKRFAMAVYEWLSYLNPFARHSPSLVDNVTNGVSTILDQYKRLYGVKNVLRESIAAHQAFLAATGAASSNLQMQEFQLKKADIVAVSPNAGPAVDRLVGSIFKMQWALRSVNAEIRTQSSLVVGMESNLAAAMKPFTEAIAKNKREQDELRLAILKMEQDGGGSIDDIRAKYAALNGEIEKMRGRRENLRLGGAGKEITGPIDAQIKALADQRNAMEGQTAPIDEMRKKLEELQRAGEILTLETSLKFDPQIEALELEKQKLQELEGAYRDIESAIRDMESALNTMASEAGQEISRRTAAAKEAAGPELPAAVEDFRAGGMADFEVPEGSAPPGLGREGGLAEIDQFNKDLQDELDAALGEMGGFDFFQPLKDLWKAAWTWIYDNVWPYVEPVWSKVKEFWDGIEWGDLLGQAGDMFSGLGDDIEGSRLGPALETVKGWFGNTVEFIKGVWGEIEPVFETVVGAVQRFVSGIASELANWGPLWGDLIQASKRAFDGIIAVVGIGLAILRGAWEVFWPVFRNVFDALWNALIGIVRAALEIVRGIITVALGLINGEWSRVWDGMVTIVDGVWDMIYSIIRGAWDLIYGVVKGIVEGIVSFFQWLYDVLVGHSIIPDMVDAIIDVFNFLKDTVSGIWNALWKAIEWAWNSIAKPVWNAIKWTIDNVLIPAFQFLKNTVVAIWDGISSAISWVWNSIIKPIWDAIKWYINTQLIPAFEFYKDKAKAAFEAIGNGLKWVWENVLWPIFDKIISFVKGTVAPAFHWMAGKIGDAWNSIRNTAAGAWNAILGVIGGAVNKAIDIINMLITGINKLSNLPGIKINISHINHVSWGKVSSGVNWTGMENTGLAAGTNRIPENPFARKVGSGFKTNNVRAIVGEGNPLYPEYVIPTDPNFRGRAVGLANMLLSDLGLNNLNELHPQYAAGGLLGSAVDLAGNAWDATGGKIATGIKKGAAMAIFGPVNEAAKVLINAIPFEIARETAHGIRETMYNWVRDTDDKIPDAPQVSNMGMMTWASMWAALRSKFPDARLHSSYRPGSITATGNRSYHSMGRAIDVSPRMDIFNWLRDNYGNSRELIFSPAGNRQLRNGNNHMYTGVTRSMHWDHVHWAMQQGGLIPSLGNGGIVHPTPGGTLVRLGERGQAEAVQPLPRDFSNGKTYNFYGDLSFPNITDPADAETFIKNLEALA